jgi:hypothetical protein
MLRDRSREYLSNSMPKQIDTAVDVIRSYYLEACENRDRKFIISAVLLMERAADDLRQLKIKGVDDAD